MIVIGIDPDSDKHGVSFYKDGKLINLLSLSLVEFTEFMVNTSQENFDDICVHVEDVNAVSAAFGARDSGKNIHVKLKMAQSVGMCKQAQIEIERVLCSMGIKVVKHKISEAWKKDKALFEKITGWKGRSNEDTRSAAYFGYLGLNKSLKN